MRVLHIITNLNDGGAEAVLYRMCQFNNGNTHIVISFMDEGKYGPMLRDIGIETYTLGMSHGGVKLSALVRLFKLLRVIKPDVVQTWMYHADLLGGVVSRLSGIRNVVWGVHNTTLVKGESKRTTMLIAKLNALLSRFIPHKIVYCAEKSRSVQESLGFSKSKGVVVPNGYDISDFKPNDNERAAIRNEFGVGEGVFLIGHVGRYDPQKDHENLINAIAQLPENIHKIKVVLVGTNLDTQNDTLMKSIAKHQLTDRFILNGRRNDIPAVMNGLDLFVLSSAFGEAFPNVLNEAMACGIPCVATDVGDASVIVADTGWIVPPKNPQALANEITEAVDEAYTNQYSWSLRKEACRSRIVVNFSLKRMVEGYESVWADGILKSKVRREYDVQ